MQATSGILSVRLLHQASFAPNPENLAFPTKAVHVESRFVRDLTEFPRGVNLVFFEDIVEIEVMTPGIHGLGMEKKTFRTEPFNSETFHVLHTASDFEKFRGNNWYEIDVHPSLKGKVWVIGFPRQAEEQRAA